MMDPQQLQKQIKAEEKILQRLNEEANQKREEYQTLKSLREQAQKEAIAMQQSEREAINAYQIASDAAGQQQGKISKLRGQLLQVQGTAAGIPAGAQ